MEISLNSEELDHIKQEVSSNKEFENAIKFRCINKLSYQIKSAPDINFPTTF